MGHPYREPTFKESKPYPRVVSELDGGSREGTFLPPGPHRLVETSSGNFVIERSEVVTDAMGKKIEVWRPLYELRSHHANIPSQIVWWIASELAKRA